MVTVTVNVVLEVIRGGVKVAVAPVPVTLPPLVVQT